MSSNNKRPGSGKRPNSPRYSDRYGKGHVNPYLGGQVGQNTVFKEIEERQNAVRAENEQEAKRAEERARSARNGEQGAGETRAAREREQMPAEAARPAHGNSRRKARDNTRQSGAAKDPEMQKRLRQIQEQAMKEARALRDDVDPEAGFDDGDTTPDVKLKLSEDNKPLIALESRGKDGRLEVKWIPVVLSDEDMEAFFPAIEPVQDIRGIKLEEKKELELNENEAAPDEEELVLIPIAGMDEDEDPSGGAAVPLIAAAAVELLDSAPEKAPEKKEKKQSDGGSIMDSLPVITIEEADGDSDEEEQSEAAVVPVVIVPGKEDDDEAEDSEEASEQPDEEDTDGDASDEETDGPAEDDEPEEGEPEESAQSDEPSEALPEDEPEQEEPDEAEQPEAAENVDAQEETSEQSDGEPTVDEPVTEDAPVENAAEQSEEKAEEGEEESTEESAENAEEQPEAQQESEEADEQPAEESEKPEKKPGQSAQRPKHKRRRSRPTDVALPVELIGNEQQEKTEQEKPAEPEQPEYTEDPAEDAPARLRRTAVAARPVYDDLNTSSRYADSRYQESDGQDDTLFLRKERPGSTALFVLPGGASLPKYIDDDDFVERWLGNEEEEDMASDSKRRRRRISTFIGAATMLLALIGFIAVAKWGIGLLSGIGNTDTQKTEYAEFISPIVMSEVPVFETWDAIPQDKLLQSAIFNVLEEMDVTYERDDTGKFIIPSTDIVNSVKELYGAKHEDPAQDEEINTQIRNALYGSAGEDTTNTDVYYVDMEDSFHVADGLSGPAPQVTDISRRDNTVTLVVQYLEDLEGGSGGILYAREYILTLDGEGYYVQALREYEDQ